MIGSLRADNLWKVRENIRRAEEVAALLWQSGFAVICPHLNTGSMMGVCPEENFLSGDLVMLKHCDFAVVVGNYQTSEGSLGEINFCLRRINPPIPIYYNVYEAINKEKSV